jgi:transketolase
MRSHFATELQDMVSKDSRIQLIACDLGYGVLDNFAEKNPNNYLNLGITEQASMSIAAGLAAKGLRPFIYSIANFPTFRCLEQIRNDVHGMELPVTIVSVGAGLGYGKAGYSHFAVEDISALRSLQIDIYNPSDLAELTDSLKSILANSRPAYLRLGGKLASDVSHAKLTQNHESSAEIALVYSGDLKSIILDAVNQINLHGIDIKVASIPKLVQADIDAFLLSSPRKIVAVEEHVLSGGFSSFLLERISDLGLETRVSRIGIADLNPHLVGSQTFLQSMYGITSENIVAKVLAMIGQSS